jgi:hypothetical protein
MKDKYKQRNLESRKRKLAPHVQENKKIMKALREIQRNENDTKYGDYKLKTG